MAQPAEADGFRGFAHLVGYRAETVCALVREAFELRFVLDIAEFRRTGFRAEPFNLLCECEVPD